jgi:hypothetical protein
MSPAELAAARPIERHSIVRERTFPIAIPIVTLVAFLRANGYTGKLEIDIASGGVAHIVFRQTCAVVVE